MWRIAWKLEALLFWFVQFWCRRRAATSAVSDGTGLPKGHRKNKQENDTFARPGLQGQSRLSEPDAFFFRNVSHLYSTFVSFFASGY